MKVITKALARKWVKALRSGKYKQGRGQLRKGNQHGSYHCCLGVAEEVLGVRREDFQYLGQPVLPKNIQRILAQMNDGVNGPSLDFNEIAAYIETKVIPTLPDRQP